MDLLDLPLEMLQHVAYFLDSHSLAVFSQVCNTCRDIGEIDYLWQQLCDKDFKIKNIRGWNLSYKDFYTKVLKKFNCFGLRRLALLPYGGLVNIAWGEGEINVTGLTGVNRESSQHPLIEEPYYVLRWSHDLDKLQVFCAQSENEDQEATLVDDGVFPLLRCCGHNKLHMKIKRKGFHLNEKYGKSSKHYKGGFQDHSDAFINSDLSEGFNAPLLPLPAQSSIDGATRSPINLGLYTGEYGSHGTEIIYFMMNSHTPCLLEGLKIVGDPNVPAGYWSVQVSLDRPMLLTQIDQMDMHCIRVLDEGRTDEEYRNLMCSNDNNPDLSQPFSVPVDCFERGGDVIPNTCLARYLGRGRIAGHHYTDPSFCQIHFMIFSNDLLGVLWLDLFCFSLFRKIKR